MSTAGKYPRELGVKRPLPYTESLGQRIRLRLTELNMSQAELARRMKVCRAVVCRLCQGVNDPCLSTATSIAEVLGVRLEWLATGNGEMLQIANYALSDPEKH